LKLLNLQFQKATNIKPEIVKRKQSYIYDDPESGEQLKDNQ